MQDLVGKAELRGICNTCSMPIELCVCNLVLPKQANDINITVTSTSGEKPKTILGGIKHQGILRKLLKKLRKMFRCCGKIKGGVIILHGDFSEKIRQLIHSSPPSLFFVFKL